MAFEITIYFIYLQGRVAERGRNRKRPFVHWFPPRMRAVAQACDQAAALLSCVGDGDWSS